MIIQNQVKCKLCGDEPFSAHRHDFKSCKCGAVSVDGGLDYLRRVGNMDAMEEMSISIPDEALKACIDAVEWSRTTGRNAFGTVCAIMRQLRDHGLIKTDEEEKSV